MVDSFVLLSASLDGGESFGGHQCCRPYGCKLMWGGSRSLSGRLVTESKESGAATDQRHSCQSPEHFTTHSVNGNGLKLKAINMLYVIASPEDKHFGTRDTNAHTAATCVLHVIRSAGVTSLH